MTDEELRAVWELAKWPPTRANTQPLRVVYIRTAEGRHRVIRHMAEGHKAETAAAPVVAVLAAGTDFHDYGPQLFQHRPELKDAFADPGGRESSLRFDAILQSGYFLLAVRAEGLAAGPMTGFDRDGLDAEPFPEGRFRLPDGRHRRPSGR